MQMGDKIVVMNNAVVEQFGTPQEIYDKPATMFVAAFIGSPSMNFLEIQGGVGAGESAATLGGQSFGVPQLREAGQGALAFGVRPEHVTLSDEGDFRGRVLTSEYLGTTQIVTLDTVAGEVKARISSAQIATPGETVGLGFDARTVTLFDKASGRALRSELNEGVLADG
jgi:multiple sugar transport system ATP-binding protein